MNAVLGLTEHLESTDLTGQQLECIRLAHRRADELFELLEDYLDLAELESGRTDPHRRPTVIRDCLERAAHAIERRGLDVVVHPVTGDPPHVELDADRLIRSVIQSAGSQILGGSTIELDASWSEGVLTVTIGHRDAGADPRTGSVPAVVEEINAARVALLGGTLDWGVRRGRRAVRITVPAPACADDPMTGAAVGLAAKRAPRVLVVDDDATSRLIAELMLGRLGAEVETAADGAAGVEACRSQPRDLVLMDVQMPGLSGLDAAQQIRRVVAERHQPVIIACTAGTLSPTDPMVLAAGVDGQLAKPLRVEDLTIVLERVGLGQLGPAIPPVRHGSGDVPIDLAVLADRNGPDDAGAVIDVLVPVFLGQMRRVLPELRATVDHRDAAAAEELLADAIESGSTVGAGAVVGGLQLARTALVDRSWDSMARTLDDVEQELDRLGGWFVERSIEGAVAG